MRNLRRQSSSRLASVLGLCLGLLLAAQWLEAGHFHEAGWAAPDCVQCQLDTSQAVPADVPASPVLLAQQKASAPDLSSPTLAAVYRHHARGPPLISD